MTTPYVHRRLRTLVDVITDPRTSESTREIAIAEAWERAWRDLIRLRATRCSFELGRRGRDGGLGPRLVVDGGGA